MESWFDTVPEAAPYRSLKNEILSLFLDAERAGVPHELLFVKMKEGAAKRIPPDRLLEAILQEARRLRTARGCLDDAGYLSGDYADDLIQSLKILGIVLREGVSEDLVREMLGDAYSRNLPPSNGAAACGAVFQIKKITGLTEEELLRLGRALYESSLPAAGYDALVSLFLKARVSGISEQAMFEIVLRVFSEHGGLVQLEREMNRRVPNR